MPEPEIEPGEPNPGGVDAIDGGANGTIPDLPPSDNPSIDEKAPETGQAGGRRGRGHLDQGDP